MIGDKGAIRRDLRARRHRVSAAEVATAAAAVAERLFAFSPYLRARTLVAYVATEHEIPIDEIVADAWRSGRAVLLPHQGIRGFAPWRQGESLAEGPWGIFEPCTERCVWPTPPALVLVPLVAWDSTGTRLGRGAGFYDRALATVDPGVTRVGVAYEFQEYRGLPRDTWDVPVHYVITERRVVTCTAPEAVRLAAGV